MYTNIHLLCAFLLSGNPPKCHCLPLLTTNGVDCRISHSMNRYHNWGSNNILWMQTVDDSKNKMAFHFSTHYPFSYCKPSEKDINLCSPNDHCAGVLCGGCAKNLPPDYWIFPLHSLPTQTITIWHSLFSLQLLGSFLLNGLIFYVNIIWAYQNILFPSDM